MQMKEFVFWFVFSSQQTLQASFWIQFFWSLPSFSLLTPKILLWFAFGLPHSVENLDVKFVIQTLLYFFCANNQPILCVEDM